MVGTWRLCAVAFGLVAAIADIEIQQAEAIEECGTSLVQKVFKHARVPSSGSIRVVLSEEEDSDAGDAVGHAHPPPLSLSQESAEVLQEWYPTRISGTGDNARVVLSKFNNREHSQLLKPDTHDLGHGSEHRRIPISEFIASQQEVTTPIFLSYKVARCGSTLLDSMLTKDPRFLLIAEPQVLNQVGHAIPGDTDKERDQRKKVYRALVFYMARFVTAEQQVSFFDLNSQTSTVMLELTHSVPEAHSFLLWRTPIEVADSLYNKPPGWLRQQAAELHERGETNSTLLVAIENHLERVIGAPNTELIDNTNDFPVFWYQHVTNGLLPRWVVEKSFGEANVNDKEIKEMTDAAQINSKTGKPWPAGKIDHNELSITSDLKQLGLVWYNENLVNFTVQHGPIVAEKKSTNKIKELHWPEDVEEIKAHLSGDLIHEPVVVRNALASTSLAEKSPEEIYGMLRDRMNSSKRDFSLLAAEKENYFVWHNKRKATELADHYHVVSKWRKGNTWDEFEKNPRVQIIDGLDSDMIDMLDHPGSVLDLVPTGDKVRRHGPGLSLRVSHAGAQTALHYDCGSSLLMQLSGTKEILLWPASEVENLYPYPKSHFMYRRMLADPEYLDPVNLPNFKMDSAVRTRSGAGDLVVWPARWAHHIRTVDGPSVSVGKRWGWKVEDRLPPPASPSDELISKVEALRYAKGFPLPSGNGGKLNLALLQVPDEHDDAA